MADNMKIKVTIDGDGNLASHVNKDVAALDKLDDGAKRSHASLSNVATVAGGIAVAGVAALAGGIGFAVGKAAEFEKSLSAIQAVSGSTAEEMAAVKDLALDLGASTAFSAKEAAEGIGELVKGGVSVADIMGGAASAALNLAAAGGTSVADAAALAANAMSLFNIEGSEMGKVADSIAGFANATTGSVNDFKFALSSVGAAAHLAGQEFDQTATAIALMGKAGILGSDAGTSLKTFLLNLVPSSKDARAEFEKWGITTLNQERAIELLTGELERFGSAGMKVVKDAGKDGVTTFDELYKGLQKLNPALKETDFGDWATDMGLVANKMLDAEGNFKDLSEIAGVLKEAMDGLSESQQTVALKTMFGSDAIRAAAILAQAGAEGFNEMAEAMSHVSAEAVANVRLDNLAGSMDTLNGTTETAAILLGQELTPALKDVADGANKFLAEQVIPWVKEHGPALGAAVRGWVSDMGKLVEAIAPIVQSAGPALRGILDGIGEGLDATIKFTYDAIVAFVNLKNGIGEFFDGVGTKSREVLTTIKNLPATLAAEAGKAAEGLGASMVAGIARGLNPAVVADKMREIAGGAIAAGVERIRSGSPSKETEERIGIPMMTGILAGLEARRQELLEGVTSITEDVLARFAPLRDPFEGRMVKETGIGPLVGQMNAPVSAPQAASGGSWGGLRASLDLIYGSVTDISEAVAEEEFQTVVTGPAPQAVGAWGGMGAAIRAIYGPVEEVGTAMEETTTRGGFLARAVAALGINVEDAGRKTGPFADAVRDLGTNADETGRKVGWLADLVGDLDVPEEFNEGLQITRFKVDELDLSIGSLRDTAVSLGPALQGVAANIDAVGQAAALGAARAASFNANVAQIGGGNPAGGTPGQNNSYAGGMSGQGTGLGNPADMSSTPGYPLPGYYYPSWIGTAMQVHQTNPPVAPPGMGAWNWGMSWLPLPPHFAGGVTDFAGGLAVVGEEGPELAYLPSGSSVYPHGTGPGGGGSMRLHPDDIHALAQAMSHLSIQVDHQTLGQVVRTEGNYHEQRNLARGVGAMVSGHR